MSRKKAEPIPPAIAEHAVRARLGGASDRTIANETGLREAEVWHILYRLRAKYGNMRAAYLAMVGEEAPR